MIQTNTDQIATITELRAQTTDVLDHVRDTDQTCLILRNNERVSVIMSPTEYDRLKSLERRVTENDSAAEERPTENKSKPFGPSSMTA